MSDDEKPMAYEERRAFLEQLQQDNLASMTPFERYLYHNGLFDDRIRPEITAEDVVLEPQDLLHRFRLRGMYRILEEQVRWAGYLLHPRMPPEPRVTDVPYNHCSYIGCVNCPEVVRQGVVVSHSTCAHHRFVQ